MSNCGAIEARLGGGRAWLLLAAFVVCVGLALAPPASAQWTSASSMSVPRSFHSATLLGDGRVLVAGGVLPGTGKTAEIYSPSTDAWSSAGEMTVNRSQPRATRLSDGRVLVTGSTRETDIYDPATNTWSPTGPMSVSRGTRYQTVSLADGRVMAIGSNLCGADAEVWSPTTGLWSPAGAMSIGRCQHTATLLANGKVLVASGRASSGAPIAGAELYDPATNTWAPAGPMGVGRYRHEATLLTDGRVLVAGGWATTGSVTTYSATAEVYSPVTNTWSPTMAMSDARSEHKLTLLTSGKVLVTGGAQGEAGVRVELYDPATGRWRRERGMAFERSAHGSTLLSDGRVLVTGGQNFSVGVLDSAEVYEPPGVMWEPAGSLAAPRLTHAAIRLASGKVLAIGGTNGLLPRAELYDPRVDTWSSAGTMGVDRTFDLGAALLADGRVLVAGGFSIVGIEGNQASAELYDPGGNAWSDAAPMSVPRVGLTLTRLPDGRVLAAGGSDNVGSEDIQFKSTELYDPASNTWSPAADMSVARTKHTAILLENGKVLVVGGANTDGGILASTELYDPATNTWTPAGPLPGGARASLAVTKLGDGRVLVVGGCSLCGRTFVGARDSADLYDPSTNSWSAAAPMKDARWFATATLLENGRVVVVGGLDSDRVRLWSSEVYDPATDAWARGPALEQPRYGHSATLISNGVVLVAGGAGDTVLRSSERAKPPCSILGAEGDDVLAGTSRADSLCGLGGDDQLAGNGGDDVIEGGPGDDSLSGGAGADTLTGDAGLDVFAGGDGDDVIRARDGVGESLTCGAGVDVAVVDSLDTFSGCETVDAPDTTAPETTIDSGPAAGSATGDSTPTFAFSSGEVGSGFECRVDGQAFAACSSPHTTAALGDGQHTFAVRATDQAGNTDQTPASRTFTVDTTAPETTITAGPAAGSATADSTSTFAFSSGEAALGFECRVDAAVFAPCSSPHTTAALGDGQHTFAVRATDQAGNTDQTPAGRTFTVAFGGGGPFIDTTPPVARLSGRKIQRAGPRIIVIVSCRGEACRAAASGTVRVRGAGKALKLRPTTRRVGAGRKAKLTLRVPKKAQRVIRKARRGERKVTAKIRVRVTDAAGNASTRRRTVRIKR